MSRECYKGCGATSDLRPYGPKGEWVCFKCAFSTPEDKAATEASFGGQLDAAIHAGKGIAIAGCEVGPYPYSGPRCPSCGAVEVEAMTPATVYACGSRDYDQRPGTFKQSEDCAAAQMAESMGAQVDREAFKQAKADYERRDYRDDDVSIDDLIGGNS